MGRKTQILTNSTIHKFKATQKIMQRIMIDHSFKNSKTNKLHTRQHKNTTYKNIHGKNPRERISQENWDFPAHEANKYDKR